MNKYIKETLLRDKVCDITLHGGILHVIDFTNLSFLLGLKFRSGGQCLVNARIVLYQI